MRACWDSTCFGCKGDITEEKHTNSKTCLQEPAVRIKRETLRDVHIE